MSYDYDFGGHYGGGGGTDYNSSFGGGAGYGGLHYELEKVKQEKADLQTKLENSILTTAKNRMEKKYHEKDLELAKATAALAKANAAIEKMEMSKNQLEEKEKKDEVSQNLALFTRKGKNFM